MTKIRYLVLIILPVAAFAAWFGWMSFVTSRTEWIQTETQAALNAAMESLAPQLPRIEIHDTASGEDYYAPDIHNPAHAFDLYGQLLITLNQDPSVPPVKVSLVSMSSEYGPTATTLSGQATIEFPLAAGIEKTIVVRTSVQVPHYKTSQ